MNTAITVFLCLSSVLIAATLIVVIFDIARERKDKKKTEQGKKRD